MREEYVEINVPFIRMKVKSFYDKILASNQHCVLNIFKNTQMSRDEIATASFKILICLYKNIQHTFK